MRLASFSTGFGESFGVVTENGIVDARKHCNGQAHTLRDALRQGRLDQLKALAKEEADYARSDVTFLPVIHDPGAKFLCVGVNYLPHIREMGREQPPHPVIFVRFANSLVGHRQALLKPSASEEFDFEGELAVIIGKPAHRVSRDRASEYIAGYSCFNDGSIREFQWHGPQWTAGKNFYHSGAFGPWMVTADEIDDPAKLHLQTRLNGAVVQTESVGELCFDVAALIEYISSWAALEPGDVIATGTPGGVGAGRTPPLWMRDGDLVEVEISGVGTLQNPVADEAP